MTSGGSLPQGVPGVGKKAGAVADRSGVPLLYTLACLYRSLPHRRERRNAFPGSQVFGTGTLPVGFQGRSALVAEGEIPVQEIYIRRYFSRQYGAWLPS